MRFFELKRETEREAKVKKILKFFFWGSLVPVIVISAAAYFSGRIIIRNQATEFLSAVNNAESEQLNLFIEKLKARTADWASDGKIRESAEKIESECPPDTALSACPLVSELSAYLKNKKLPIDPTIVLADVLDINGVVIASSNAGRLGMDEGKERISFPEAKAAPFGETILTPELVVEEDELAGASMLHLATPLVSVESGKTIGVFLTHVLSDELNEVLAISQGKTLEVYLVNRDKLMITPSRFIPDAVLAQSVNTPPVRACLDRGKDYRGSHLNYKGEPVFGVSKCLPEGFGMIITEIDESEAFAGIAVFRNIMVSGVAVVVIAVLIYIFFSGRKLLPQFTTTTTTTTTTTIIIVIIGIIGIAFSLFFSKTIEQFVFRAKTEPIFDLVQGQANRHIGKAEYFGNWRSAESQRRFEDFAAELKTSLPAVAAIKIYDTQSVLAWSDLAEKKTGEVEESEDVIEALRGKQKVETAEKEIQKQLGLRNLLEIYTPVYLEDKSVPAGVVEIYFDISDLISFIRQLQVFIWGIIGISLAIIYSLLSFVFRKQNKKISDQAVELEKYSKGLEKIVSERTAELKEKVGELEKINDLMVGRELKMIELKEELQKLKSENHE